MREELANALFKTYYSYYRNENPKLLQTYETCFFVVPKGSQNKSYSLLQDRRNCFRDGIQYTKYTFRLYDGKIGSRFQLAASCPLYEVKEPDPNIDRSWEGIDSYTGIITFYPWELGEQLQKPVVSQIGIELHDLKETQVVEISFAVKAQNIPFVLRILNEGDDRKRRIFTLTVEAPK